MCKAHNHLSHSRRRLATTSQLHVHTSNVAGTAGSCGAGAHQLAGSCELVVEDRLDEVAARALHRQEQSNA